MPAGRDAYRYIVFDPTHSSLHAMVERYIRSVDASQWPAPLREQGDRAVDAACQYGLGLIRLLAEYQVLEGLPDTHCAELASTLMAACANAKRAIECERAPNPEPSFLKPIWRAGLRSRKSAGGARRPTRRESPNLPRSLSPATSSAPRATSASADTPAARGSDGTGGEGIR